MPQLTIWFAGITTLEYLQKGVCLGMGMATYGVGDGATNIITPLMPYFPLILVFCQRWQKDFGLGSLAATMLPYSMLMLLSGLVMTVVWVLVDLPLGPSAPIGFELVASDGRRTDSTGWVRIER